MWDLSFLARNQTCTPCIGRQSLNYLTTGKSLGLSLFFNVNSFWLCWVLLVAFMWDLVQDEGSNPGPLHW